MSIPCLERQGRRQDVVIPRRTRMPESGDSFKVYIVDSKGIREKINDLQQLYKETGAITAFNDLYRLCFSELKKFLTYQYRLSIDDAEDILQEYFSKSFETSIKRYDQRKRSNFLYYVQHLISLRVYTLHKQKKNYHYRENQDHSLTGRSSLPEVSSFDVEEVKQNLIACLYVLKKKYKDAIILCFLYPSLTNRERANIIGCKARCFSARLYRAKKMLKAKLRKSIDLADMQQVIKAIDFRPLLEGRVTGESR